MNLVIMAAPRKAPNWHSTLASAVLTAREELTSVTVCLDAHRSEVPEAELEVYSHLRTVTVLTLTDAEYSAQCGRTPKIRALYNAIRCLRAAVFDDGLCTIVEDDLTFAHGWALMAPTGKNVVLGYTRETATTDGFVEFPDAWDATLCVVWPSRELCEAAAEALEKNLSGAQLPADNALTTFWKDNGIRRWTIVPSLVQHLGDDALINPQDGKRRSPMWREN